MGTSRWIIVGDVHGCPDELEALLKAVGFGKGDRLVHVGDLVSKGPDSHGAVALAREHRALGVRGNHDARVLSWYHKKQIGEPLPELKPQHQKVVAELVPEDWKYLQSMPLYLRLEVDLPRPVLVVHAGVVPGVTLAQQQEKDLITLRSIRPDGTGSSKIPDGEPWAPLYSGPEEIVFGHDAVRGVQHTPFAIGLDSGCCYGRELSCYLLPERRIVSVRAKKTYRDPYHKPD
jgi:Calcineurin-like phosphoesterase